MVFFFFFKAPTTWYITHSSTANRWNCWPQSTSTPTSYLQVHHCYWHVYTLFILMFPLHPFVCLSYNNCIFNTALLNPLHTVLYILFYVYSILYCGSCLHKCWACPHILSFTVLSSTFFSLGPLYVFLSNY